MSTFTERGNPLITRDDATYSFENAQKQALITRFYIILIISILVVAFGLVVIIVFGHRSSPATSASFEVTVDASDSSLDSASLVASFAAFDNSTSCSGSTVDASPSVEESVDSLDSCICGTCDSNSIDCGSWACGSLASESITDSTSLACACLESKFLQSGSFANPDSLNSACDGTSDSAAISQPDSLGIGASVTASTTGVINSIGGVFLDVGDSCIDIGLEAVNELGGLALEIAAQLATIPLQVAGLVSDLAGLVINALSGAITAAFEAIIP